MNGPMILAHRIICEQTGRNPFCQRANAPKGSIQLHSANAALFAWMAALGR